MKTILNPKYSKLGFYELNLLRDGIDESFTNLVLGLMTPGLIIKKLSNGVLKTDFLVTGSNSLVVNAGYLTYNDNGIIRVIKFPSTNISIDESTYPNGAYFVCIKPKASSYEKGTLTFTNGSTIVASSLKESFKYLRPGGSIIIENTDSVYGNGGIYPIISTAPDSATLSIPFTGTTENNLKWKIGAEFPSNYSVSDNTGRLAYQYDAYDLVIQSSPTGFVLAEITMNSGIASIDRDRRAAYLASFNNNGANADDILSGGINNITTIEEKASAARVDKILKGMYTKGIRSGLSVITTGNDTIRVYPGEAIDGNGKLIIQPNNVNFNIKEMFDNNELTEGDNYLHIVYKQPNSYQWFWGTAESTSPSQVVVAKINYSTANSEN